MPTFRDLFQRLVIFQPSSGYICDLSARRALRANGIDASEERARMADGTTRAVNREYTVRLPVIGSEEAEILEQMKTIGCPVQALGIGDDGVKHFMFWEEAALSLVDDRGGALTAPPRTLEVQSSVFDAAVFQGTDLLSGLPWHCTTAYDITKGQEPGGGTEAAIERDAYDVTVIPGGGPNGELLLALTDPAKNQIIILDAEEAISRTNVEEAILDTYPSPGAGLRGIAYAHDGAQQGRLFVWDETNTLYRLSTFSTFSGETPAVSASQAYQFLRGVGTGLAYKDGGLYVAWPEFNSAYRISADTLFFDLEAVATSTLYGITTSDYQDYDGYGFYVVGGDGREVYTTAPNFSKIATAISSVPGAVGIAQDTSQSGLDGSNIASDQLRLFIAVPGTGRVRVYDSFGGTLRETGRIDLNARTPEMRLARRIASGSFAEAVGGYEGPLWAVDDETAYVDAEGALVNTDGGALPATIEVPCPLPGATLQLTGNRPGDVDGTITVLDWYGQELMSAAADEALRLYSDAYAAIGYALPAWRIRVDISRADSRPRLVVLNAGRALGSRPGEVITGCTERAERPTWQPPETPDAVAPLGADFTYQVQGRTVQFFPEVEGADNYSIDWDFGSRLVPKSTDPEPTITYTGDARQYTVILTVTDTDLDRSRRVVKTVQLERVPTPPPSDPTAPDKPDSMTVTAAFS